MYSLVEKLGLNRGDVKKEYDNLLAQGRQSIIKVNDRIIKFQNKAEKAGGTEKKKYQFLVEINQALLSEMIRELKDDNLLGLAMRQADPLLKYVFLNTPFDVWSLEYEDIDWRCKINFLKMPVSDCEKMQILYQAKETEGRKKYLECFDTYIREYEICQEIKNLTKSTYVSKDRVDVMEDAIDLYEKGRYLSFINLAAIQIEGLFNDYLKELEIEKDLPSIAPKLELLRKEAQVWGYIYYAFEFPDIRNKIAHGNILKGDLKEKSMELLADIYNILTSIDGLESIGKKMINFLQKFSEEDDKESLFLGEWMKLEREFADNDINYRYGQFYSKFVRGEFDDRIEWSNLREVASDFKDIFSTERFWESLLVEENDIHMGELKDFFKTNKDQIDSKYYNMFMRYEKRAKNRIKNEYGDDWKDLYLPHYIKG